MDAREADFGDAAEGSPELAGPAGTADSPGPADAPEGEESRTAEFGGSVEAQFRFLEEQGFETVEHYLVTEENILDTIELFEKKIDAYDIPSDGLVLGYDDIAYGRSLGRTAKFPRNSIAFKWADELRETKLLEIEWSASRTGLINPVAIFEPVELEGTTVSRASVHNISILRGLHLGIGDRITVYKANMIIPQIAENLTARDMLAQAQAGDVGAGEEGRPVVEKPLDGGKKVSQEEEPLDGGKEASQVEELPTKEEVPAEEGLPEGKEASAGEEPPADDEQAIKKDEPAEPAAEKADIMEAALAMGGHRPVEIPAICPVCGGKTEIRQVNDVQSLYCTNERCAAKQIKAFTLFVSRDAMNIDGLSEATLEKFIDMGFIQEFADLFHLDRYRERIVEMEGFGEKSYQNLIDSVERARHTTLPRVIYSLGIANIGSANAKMLCRFFDHDLKRMQEADVETLSAIDGVGEVIATAFVNYMRDEDNLRRIENLTGELEIEIPKVEEGSQTLSGLSFVITGSLEKFASRSDLKEAIEQKGGKVTGNKKAKELGIPILSEADFLAQYQVSAP